MKKHVLFYLILITFVWGCATWVAVSGKYSMSSQNFEVELPTGWRRYNLSQDTLIITKDGLLLQQIQILRKSIDEELLHTKKKLSKEMLPKEVSEVVIDNIRSNPNIMSQQIIEDTPAQIGGYSGIKLVYTYRTTAGLTKKVAHYCLLFGNWCYEILYEAPVRYYFEKDFPDFEQVVDSFRLIKATVS